VQFWFSPAPHAALVACCRIGQRRGRPFVAVKRAAAAVP
jgi:hypothetical protein